MHYEIAQLVGSQIQYQRNNHVGKLAIVAVNQTSVSEDPDYNRHLSRKTNEIYEGVKCAIGITKRSQFLH